MLFPNAAKTASGADLPLVAMPQTELLTVDEGAIPWLDNSLGEGIRIKPLRLDIEAGVWVILASFAPGSRVQLHYHTGEAEVYTLFGRWNYVEYADQPQTAGSYLFEPSGSVHTLVVPEDNAEDTLMFIRVKGANVNFNEDGSFHSILDATSLTFLTELLAQLLGIQDLGYLRGGQAGRVQAGSSGTELKLPPSFASMLE